MSFSLPAGKKFSVCNFRFQQKISEGGKNKCRRCVESRITSRKGDVAEIQNGENQHGVCRNEDEKACGF